jgi:hypothetical protein
MCMYIYIYVYVYMCMYMCVYMCMCMCMFARIHIYENCIFLPNELLFCEHIIFIFVFVQNVCVSELNEMMCCLLFSKAAPSPPSSEPPPPPWLCVYPHLSPALAAQQACRALCAAAATALGLSPLGALHTLLRRGNGLAD